MITQLVMVTRRKIASHVGLLQMAKHLRRTGERRENPPKKSGHDTATASFMFFGTREGLCPEWFWTFSLMASGRPKSSSSAFHVSSVAASDVSLRAVGFSPPSPLC